MQKNLQSKIKIKFIKKPNLQKTKNKKITYIPTQNTNNLYFSTINKLKQNNKI